MAMPVTRASCRSPNSELVSSITRTGSSVRSKPSGISSSSSQVRPAATEAAVHAPADVPSMGPLSTGMPLSMSAVTTPMSNPIPNAPPEPKHDEIG